MRHSEGRGYGAILDVSRARSVQSCRVACFGSWGCRLTGLRSVFMSMVLFRAHPTRWVRIFLMAPSNGGTRRNIFLWLERLENISRMRATKARTRPVSGEGALSAVARTQSFVLDSRRRSKGTRLLSGYSNDLTVNVDMVLIVVSTCLKGDVCRVENVPRF